MNVGAIDREAARLVLGLASEDELVATGRELSASGGVPSPSLQLLALLTGRERAESRGLFEAAPAELGRALPSEEEAAEALLRRTV